MCEPAWDEGGYRGASLRGPRRGQRGCCGDGGLRRCCGHNRTEYAGWMVDDVHDSATGLRDNSGDDVESREQTGRWTTLCWKHLRTPVTRQGVRALQNRRGKASDGVSGKSCGDAVRSQQRSVNVGAASFLIINVK